MRDSRPRQRSPRRAPAPRSRSLDRKRDLSFVTEGSVGSFANLGDLRPSTEEVLLHQVESLEAKLERVANDAQAVPRQLAAQVDRFRQEVQSQMTHLQAKVDALSGRLDHLDGRRRDDRTSPLPDLKEKELESLTGVPGRLTVLEVELRSLRRKTEDQLCGQGKSQGQLMLELQRTEHQRTLERDVEEHAFTQGLKRLQDVLHRQQGAVKSCEEDVEHCARRTEQLSFSFEEELRELRASLDDSTDVIAELAARTCDASEQLRDLRCGATLRWAEVEDEGRSAREEVRVLAQRTQARLEDLDHAFAYEQRDTKHRFEDVTQVLRKLVAAGPPGPSVVSSVDAAWPGAPAAVLAAFRPEERQGPAPGFPGAEPGRHLEPGWSPNAPGQGRYP